MALRQAWGSATNVPHLVPGLHGEVCLEDSNQRRVAASAKCRTGDSLDGRLELFTLRRFLGFEIVQRDPAATTEDPGAGEDGADRLVTAAETEQSLQ